jgi:predicted transcriptional regulator
MWRPPMTGKERALEILQTLPDDATWEEVLDAFHLDVALEESIAAVERGDVIPHEEVMRSFDRCATNPST